MSGLNRPSWLDEGLVRARTASMPKVLWIELTSRCPFDCVFCTRASLRGAGEHMDFGLYSRVLAELDRPRMIRLNYSGESGHYPRLAEAIAAAAATGAEVELVSALASLKPERLQAALEAGLNRLTVSLHTLDPQRFASIYRFGCLEALLERLEQALQWRQRSPQPFVLDLAFVAMQRNLDELPHLARWADERAIPVLAVHPLIGRDPLPMGPASEHDSSGRLTEDFRVALAHSLQAARAAAPALAIEVSSQELTHCAALGDSAVPWPGRLPDGAAIAGCDQSPFDSVHILSDGRVVACEVTEQTVLGRLGENTLASIWHAEAYRAFRMAHQTGSHPACRDCVYKSAARPGPAKSRLDAANGNPWQLLHGWHADDACGLRWAGNEAELWLPRRYWHRHVHLHGQIQPVAAHADPAFRVLIDGNLAYEHLQHQGRELQLRLPLPTAREPRVILRIERPGASSPSARGCGADLRMLGFGLLATWLDW